MILRKRKALAMTDTELKLIATPAMTRLTETGSGNESGSPRALSGCFRCRDMGLAIRASRGWPNHGLNENIHLLTNEDRKLISVEAVDDLEHPGVNTLGGVASEGLFGYDVRLKADKC